MLLSFSIDCYLSQCKDDNLNEEYNYGLLYRFAQFFNKPLMKADATMREIKAVDSG